MAKQYTDKIRIDGSGFAKVPKGSTFPITPDSYQDKVAETLDFIQSSSTPPCVGEIVLEEILFGTGNRKMTIVPRPEDLPSAAFEFRAGSNNAEVAAVKQADAAPDKVRPFRGDMDKKETPQDERENKASYVGTGRGSDATVFFTPSTFSEYAPGTKGLFGEANDDLLLHELIHALRMMQGKDNPVPTEDKHYDNQEEWLAILITNIYMSEKADWPLRAHHHDYSEMRVSSRGFLADIKNLHMMSVMAGEMASLFGSIAARAIAQPQRPPTDPTAAALFASMPNASVPVREFNPIRLFRDNRREYMKQLVGGFGVIGLVQGSASSTPSSKWSAPLPGGNQGMWEPGLQ
jgi:hypothetical protein